ncbi:GYDIA family GHMP kinase [Blattabacterium cuenoti]|uniref:GYDIA family GHMP kinase n=1 Tax=Blattabacterium cuenoti TaxID=1653831 RepID=UPI00163C8855|nr:GYDIA family GHMP kinase [Blattabacterium cuenoti]
MHKNQYFYSHGKLLLTGEYLILNGAKGLALPTVKGQSMTIFFGNEKKYNKLYWNSINEINQSWFQGIFKLPTLDICYETEIKIALKLKILLLKFQKIKKNFLKNSFGIYVKTKLDFPINWGLGSSSTLINNIAKWAKINPYQLLLDKIFLGSGYDIACGYQKQAIIYSLKNNKPFIFPIYFNPPFKNKLFFLHLNKKKNTKEGIQFFRFKNKIVNQKNINLISSITNQITLCNTLKEFEILLFKHEKIISEILDIPTIKEKYFPDYLGLVKSLGTWGGDFVLISYREGMNKYFAKKGFDTLISFDKMILYQN